MLKWLKNWWYEEMVLPGYKTNLRMLNTSRTQCNEKGVELYQDMITRAERKYPQLKEIDRDAVVNGKWAI